MARGVLFVEDLECGSEISMVTGSETYIDCDGGRKFLAGEGNEIARQIISEDLFVCNDVIIHSIDGLIIPFVIG